MHLPDGHGELRPAGLLIAAALVIFYFLVNFWSVKFFAHSNGVMTIVKLIVPAATAIALIASGFHSENLNVSANGGVHAIDYPSILTAVAIAGIVFSFKGFQSPVNLTGEAHNPGRSIPFAILGSIFLATIIYVLLQAAYLGAVPPELLAKGGWRGVDFRSSFAELAILPYADAFISPSSTGMTYTATTARIIYGMERNGTLPAILGHIHPRFGVTRPAMWLNLMVTFLSSSSFAGGARWPR